MAVRTYSLGHEMGHVLQQAHGNGAPWAEWEGRKRTHSGDLRRTAAIVLDEFDADICADAVCKLVLRNDREEPVSLDSIIGPGFIASARNLIERVASFARNDVQSYRIAAVGLEDLYPRIGPLVGELLLVLTHATAIFAGTGNIVLLQEALERIPGFKEYFELDWDRFLSAVEGKQRDADETELARIAECILHRVGLRIEDMPDGSIYVHVHEPIVING